TGDRGVGRGLGRQRPRHPAPRDRAAQALHGGNAVSTGNRDPLPDFGLLAAYWLGELEPEPEAALEEQLFADAEAAARLEVVSGVAAAIGTHGRTGRRRATLTLDAIAKLRAAGVRVREYTLAPGQIVPCTIAHEDLMVIRLRGAFAGVGTVDI